MLVFNTDSNQPEFNVMGRVQERQLSTWNNNTVILNYGVTDNPQLPDNDKLASLAYSLQTAYENPIATERSLAPIKTAFERK